MGGRRSPRSCRLTPSRGSCSVFVDAPHRRRLTRSGSASAIGHCTTANSDRRHPRRSVRLRGKTATALQILPPKSVLALPTKHSRRSSLARSPTWRTSLVETAVSGFIVLPLLPLIDWPSRASHGSGWPLDAQPKQSQLGKALGVAMTLSCQRFANSNI